MKVFDWLIDKYGKFSSFLGIVAGGIIVIIIGLMSYEVIMRYAFNAPTKFTLEISLICQQVFVGVAAAYVLKDDGHVSLELVTERLPSHWRDRLSFITSLLSAVVCGFMVYQMVEVTLWSRKVEELTSLLEWPVFPFKLILTIGLAGFGLGFIVKSIVIFRRLRSESTLSGSRSV